MYNLNMLNEIQNLITDKTKLRLGINKINEISRLVYEIYRRENISPEDILKEPFLENITMNQKIGPLNKFAKLKKYLIERRYPNAVKGKDFSVYFNRLDSRNGRVRIYSDSFYPESIFVEDKARGSGPEKTAKGLFPDVKVEYIKSIKEYRKNLKNFSGDLRKRDIFITRQNWDFFKPCPCTKGVVCCNYHIFNLGFGCPYDCSYCYLQHYTNSPGIVLDANIESFLDKIDAYLQKSRSKMIRIGTGEFTDSLALDHITEYSKILVPFFASKNVLFELKTKSSNIGNLAGLDHKGKTVVSWSLNPRSIVEKQELGTASLQERLDAAKKCSEQGYKIGFHFDPIIYYPSPYSSPLRGEGKGEGESWESDYKEVVDMLFDSVKNVEWISLGTLRFHRALKSVIEQRFPESDYLYEELVIGHDKKIRYYETLRTDIFGKMVNWIRKRDKKAALYLCMEPGNVWEQVLGNEKPYWM
ncbi:MAG: hypothetical protein JW871_01780 [Endomicrobiales bacterium]|nr:hypothetical protein [Endomicrobiales bacterium]